MSSFGYRKVAPSLWTGATGRWLRRQPPAVTVVAFYLFTCPSSSQWGVYYIPIALISNDTGIDRRGIEGALKGLRAHGFCDYDDETETVWVVNMCREQVGDLRGEDKRVKSAFEAYREVAKTVFGSLWYASYRESLQLPDGELPYSAVQRTIEGASKGHRSQDQDQDQERIRIRKQKQEPISAVAEFDFEALYQLYPRKEGKTRGMTLAKSQVKTQADYDALKTAVANYAASRASEDPKFTKQFSTFMGCWRDYVDAAPMVQQSLGKAIGGGRVMSPNELAEWARQQMAEERAALESGGGK